MLTDRALMDSRRRKTGRQAVVAVIGLAAIFAVVWFVWLRGPEEPPAYAHVVGYYADTYGSDRVALREILASSDCDQLDTWFTQAGAAYQSAAADAQARAETGLMTAAADRMNDIGCPK
jgi:hypothetical protein